MIKGNFGIRKSDIINRRMFIIGAAKLDYFWWINSTFIFITNK
jgi:hypothetical protein